MISYLDEAIFGFIFNFILTPFGLLGYLVVIYLVAYEVFIQVTCNESVCLPNRLFVILFTLLGRFVGELVWPPLTSLGYRALYSEE